MRRAAAALLLVVLVVSTGCLGFLTGQSALTFAADDVTVSDSARADAEYQQTRDEAQNVSRTFTVADTSRNVTVTNQLAEYQRTVSIPVVGERPLARFTVIASPQVEVAGQTFNPLGDLSNRDLAERLQQEYAAVENVQFVRNRTVTVLGEERTMTKFSAEATTEGGQSVDVYVQITKFRDGEDFVVGVGVYPQRLDGEQARVDTLLSGIEHPPATDGSG